MFSYLDCVKKLVQEAIFQRGISLYLQGEVSSWHKLLLPSWRKYQVRDYEITIPLIHELTNSKSPEVLEYFAKCTCPYFYEYGICKHIVAICSQLDAEFLPKLEIKQEVNISNFFDKLIETETQTNIRKFEFGIQKYLESPNKIGLDWVFEFCNLTSREPQKYQKYLNQLENQLIKICHNYDNEILVAKLLPRLFFCGGKVWWEISQDLIAQMMPKTRLDIYFETYKFYTSGAFKNFGLEEIYSKLELLEKLELVEKIKLWNKNSQIWIDFAILSSCDDILLHIVDQLDVINLLRLLPKFPDEELEIYLLRQIKLWSDYLETGNYKEISEAMRAWHNISGRSHIWEQAFEYIKKSHPKKKALIAQMF
jgi:hypothetical protein